MSEPDYRGHGGCADQRESGLQEYDAVKGTHRGSDQPEQGEGRLRSTTLPLKATARLQPAMSRVSPATMITMRRISI